MKDEGPQLEALLHRLADCPPEFLEVSRDKESIDVPAIVCDLLRPLSPLWNPELEQSKLAALREAGVPERTLVSIACWLLADEWFRTRSDLAPAMWNVLTSSALAQLARMVKPEKFVSDADRREELVRICLAGLGLRPRGETAAQGADRLATLDTIERERVLRATAAAERRAREVREAMARKKAQESASRYGE
jgi:hypothetical protein